MLDRIVRYLRSHAVPFRLASHPSPEPLPTIAVRPPPGGMLVQTHVLIAGGRTVIAVIPRGDTLDLPGLGIELGTAVAPGEPGDLPAPYTGATGAIPPLGGAFGCLTMVDERVTTTSSIVFEAFSPDDIVEIPYDDFSRLEQPRIARFAIAGELPERGVSEEPERRSA
jgi:prolyl-tRNA editing enzyme YbaK/EbsC (Cys-tRNA(Pro) deacylase)